MSDELEHRLRAAREDLPAAPTSVQERVREQALATVATASRPRFQSSRRLRIAGVARRRPLAALAATAIASVVVGAAVGIVAWPGPTGARATGVYPGPAFLPAKGWTGVAVAPGSGEPADFAPLAWTTNVPVSERTTPFSIFPLSGSDLRDLPADGILVVAWIGTPNLVPAPANPDYPDRTLPLQLGNATIQHTWEGQPRPDIPQYILSARVNQRWVDVRAYFGTRDPSAATRRAAQAALERLVLPR